MVAGSASFVVPGASTPTSYSETSAVTGPVTVVNDPADPNTLTVPFQPGQQARLVSTDVGFPTADRP